MRLSAGQYFGQGALASPTAKRAATVTAKGLVKALTISRQKFEELFGPLSALTAARRHWQETLALQREALSHGSFSAIMGSLSLDDLHPVATFFTLDCTTFRCGPRHRLCHCLTFRSGAIPGSRAPL